MSALKDRILGAFSLALDSVHELRDVDPNVGGGTDRDKLPAADFAGKNRSFPIVSPGDVADAASSIGRAGDDNYSADQLKANIIRIAKRKGAAFVAQLPKAWRAELEAGEFALADDERPTREFLARMYDHLKTRIKDGELTEDDFLAAVRHARGHAGGKRRGMNQAQLDAATAELTEPMLGPEDASVMVGLWVPESVAADLAVAGGETPDQLHLTLCYLGKLGEVGDMGLARVLVAAERIAMTMMPFTAQISGSGRFNASPSSDDQDVLYASVDAPELSELRGRLISTLTAMGCAPVLNHGFTPHITLAYVEPGSGDLPTVPTQALRCDALTVAVGDAHIELPFTGPRPGIAESAYTEPSSRGSGSQSARGAGDPPPRQDAPRAELALHEFTWGVEFGEGKPIQIMRTGDFEHPEYGHFAITDRDLAEIKQNFDAQVRGQDIPIDIDHDHKGGAVGWIRELAVQDGELWATPEWTDDGEQKVGSGQYRYFSPHFGPWEDPETGTAHRVVLMSGAITNFPFLKRMEPLSLSEFAARQKGDPMAMDLTEMQAKLTEAEGREAERVKQLAELATANQQLTERLETQERELAEQKRAMRVKRLTDVVHGNGNPNARWVGNEEQQVTFLLKLAETFGEDSEEVNHYIAEQQTHSTQIRESGLFKEVGSSGSGGPATAEDEIERRVTALMTETGKPKHEALQALMASEPALYARYSRELARRAKEA